MMSSIFCFFCYLGNKVVLVLVKASNFIFGFNQINFIRRNAYWKSKLRYLGSYTKFYHNVTIHSPHLVKIGHHTVVGDNVLIWGNGEVEIGNDVLIAAQTVITSAEHDTNALLFRDTLVEKKIVIHDNVWLGAGVIVTPGVTIGAHSIIGAGSVVNKDIPENSIAVGVPAKVIKNRSL